MRVKTDEIIKVRETFTIPKYISKELKELSELLNEKKSRIVTRALEEFLNKNRYKIIERKKSFKNLIKITQNLPSGKIGDKKIQDLLGENEK